MKYINNRFSAFAGLLFFVFIVGVIVHAASNPSVTVTSSVLPAFEVQPSAQSSGLPIDILGIPTGNGATASPEPNIDLNRCGPGMVLGFGQVVYDQTDMTIKGLDEVTNLVLARRHLSRRDQTKTLRNEEYSSGTLTVGVEYRWIDVSGNPDFSTVGAGAAGSYAIGDTFQATSTSSPTWGTGTARLQLAEEVIDKHSPFGPAWALNYSHTITRYGNDIIMDSYGRRDCFKEAPLAAVTSEVGTETTVVKKVMITHQPIANEKWIVRLNNKSLTHTVGTGTTDATKSAVAQALSNLINSEQGYSTSFTSSNEFFTITYTGTALDVLVVAENVWEGSAGRFGRLTYTISPSPQYTLRMSHGTILEFEADNLVVGKPAHLSKIISPNTQNTLQFTYEAQAQTASILQRKLLSITDSLGRNTTFTYGGDTDYVQGVSSITDFSGRTVQYDYDSSGRLLSMRSPTVSSIGNIDDFTNGKTYKYQYLSSTSSILSNSLTAVIFPNQVADGSNTARYQWTYDEAIQGAGSSSNPYLGYVKSYTLGAGTFSYTYRALASFIGADSNKPLREIKVTDRKGTQTVYKTNRLGQIVLEEVKSRGLRSNQTGSYAKLFKYNDDGQLIQVDDSMGSSTQYFYAKRRDNKAITGNIDYPNAGNPRNIEFPMTDMILIPDEKRGADQQRIHTKVVYEPVYNRPFKSVDPRGLTGSASRAAFTTTTYYDYMEALDTNKSALADLLGISSTELTSLLPTDLVQVGDVNADTITNQKIGNAVKVKYPTVTLPSQSQLSLLGISTVAEETFRYNAFGQLIRHQDTEDNVTTYSYYDISGAASTSGGGYLHTIIRDAEAIAGRNNSDVGTPPAALSQTTTYEYNQQNVALNVGATATSFPANLRGIPTAIIDPRGTKTNYYVNELDQITREVRAASATSATGLTALAYESLTLYDANNNIVETRVENKDTLTDLAGSVNSDETVNDWIITTQTFDIMDQPISVVIDSDNQTSSGELDIKTAYTYDANQNRITESYGDASTTTLDEYTQTTVSYDERDLVISRTFGAGETEAATFEQSVDANGNVTVYVDGEDSDANDSADGVTGGDPTKITYDGFNRKKEVVDRAGNRTVYTYDSASNVVSTKYRGKLISTGSEVLLSQENTEYDERNRITGVNRALFHYDDKIGQVNEVDSEPNDEFVTKAILYDGLNREVASLDEEQGLQRLHYNGLSQLIKEVYEDDSYTEFAYDANSNVTQVIEAEVNSTDSTMTSFITAQEYDALNRLTKVTEPNGKFTNYAYDSRDNNIRVTDANLNTVEMTYDRVNRIVQTDTFLSNNGKDANRSNFDVSQSTDGKITMQYVWDDLNRIVSEIDDNGTAVLSVYDDLNRKIKTTYADNSTIEWNYNDDGDVIEYKDRNGTKITRVYDANSRIVTEAFIQDTTSNLERSGTTERRWVYDGLNRVISNFNNNDPNTIADDVTCLYVYDSLSRVIRETQRIGSSTSTSNDLSTETEWEGAANNRKVASVYPNGRTFSRTFDNTDRLVRVEEINATSTDLIASFTYKGPYQTIGATYGNGITLSKAFDTNRRVTEIIWEKDNFPIVHYVNTYNDNNLILSEDRQHLGVGNYDSYTYDSANRMTEFLQDATIDNTDNSVTGGIQSLRELSGTNMMTTFSDKGVNNVLVVDNVDVDGDGSVDKLNHYTKFNGKSRKHDRNGNLDDKNTNDTTDSNDPEFVQDHLSRIVKVRNGSSNTPVVEYVYDADGRLVLRKENTQTIRYLYDGSQIVEERDWTSKSVLRQYVSGRDVNEHIQMRVYSDSDVFEDYYYHYNENGSTGAITGSTGNIVEYYEYDWFGQSKIIEGFGTVETYDEDVRGLYLD